MRVIFFEPLSPQSFYLYIFFLSLDMFQLVMRGEGSPFFNCKRTMIQDVIEKVDLVEFMFFFFATHP